VSRIAEFGLRIFSTNRQAKKGRQAMNQQPGGNGNDQAKDVGDNEVGPTEKLRESDKPESELSVPGTQNPASEEIKDEQGPNSE
jgi:hypothetical protein